MEKVKKQGMESLFCPYKQSLALKELRFEEPCMRGWDKNGKIWYHPDSDIILDNPTFSQAFRFFREQLLLDSCIIPYWFIDGEYKVKKYTYSIEPSNRFDEYFDCDSDEYDTYKDAELECIKKLIELAKEQNVK